MKLPSAALLSFAFFTVLSAAEAPLKAVIVSYPQDTVQSVVDQAMEAIKKAGGVITHEYSIIKGFAAKAPESALETVQALGQQNNIVIEQDQMVGINHA